ncbi:Hypothetical protein A7982_05694 [Minicystis rosea]|nr:Hypothetical protein A7982_05694 [Minicystis rosea]
MPIVGGVRRAERCGVPVVGAVRWVERCMLAVCGACWARDGEQRAAGGGDG